MHVLIYVTRIAYVRYVQIEITRCFSNVDMVFMGFFEGFRKQSGGSESFDQAPACRWMQAAESASACYDQLSPNHTMTTAFPAPCPPLFVLCSYEGELHQWVEHVV